jgi:hypothetical protein
MIEINDSFILHFGKVKIIKKREVKLRSKILNRHCKQGNIL